MIQEILGWAADIVRGLAKNERVRGQLHSFAKTYATIFMILYLRDITGGVQEGADFALFNFAIIGPAAKWAALAVIRNFYTLLIETPKPTTGQ